MQKFIVEGGVTLSGSITPSGNKNEALPVLAAALMANEPVIIHNVPEILDISIMKDLLSGIGVVIKQSDKHSYHIDPGHIHNNNPDQKNAIRIRGSFLLAGPLLARKKSVVLPSPGGDRIGLRPVQTHLSAMEKLGTRIKLNDKGFYEMETDGLKGAEIYLDEVDGISPVQLKELTKLNLTTGNEFLAADRKTLLSVKGFGDKTVNKIAKIILSKLDEISPDSNYEKEDLSSNEESVNNTEEVELL